jgi:hypothetical protein
VLEDLRDAAQGVVAGQVAVAVVVDLEVIDVDHQHRQRQPRAVAALHLQRQPLAEVPVVVQAGEPVGDRQLGEARVQRLELARAGLHLLLERGVQGRQLGVLALELRQQLLPLALQAEARQEVLDGEPQIGLVPGLGDVLVEARAVDGVHHRVEAGLPGEQDLHGARAALVDLFQQLDALHARHDLVGDHHRQLLAVLLQIVDQLQRLARVLGDRDVALAAEARRQLLPERGEDALLVVDTENVLAHRQLVRVHAGPSGIRCPVVPRA